MEGQVPNQGDLRFGAYPALDPVTPHQQHKSGAALQGLFQARQPSVANAERVFIAKNAQAGLFQCGSQCNARIAVGAAVAQEYLPTLPGFRLRHAGGGCSLCAIDASLMRAGPQAP